MGDGSFRIWYDFAGISVQLLPRLAVFPNVQSLLQPEAQSIRDHSRSFVSVSHREAQRSSGRSLLRCAAAQRVRSPNRRGGNRENASAPLPAAVAETESG